LASTDSDRPHPAAWGAGGAEMQSSQMGFQDIRVKVLIEGDATRSELDEIVRHANFYSPVANTMRNPISFSIALAD
jgi:organic hydroperoxide reductase OsmC/OhrA